MKIENIALLDMDGTLLAERTVDVLCDVLGKRPQLREIERRASRMPAHAVSEEVAQLFRGTNRETMRKIFNSIPLNPGARDLVEFLKGHRFKVIIVTNSYQFLAEELASELKVDGVCGIEAIFDDDTFTGKLRELPRVKRPNCRKHALCKLRILKETRKGLSGIVLAVGDDESDLCMISEADIGIAFRPKGEKLRKAAMLTVESFEELKRLLSLRWIGGEKIG